MMRNLKVAVPVLAGLLFGAGFHAPASAWASANRFGGHSEGGWGGESHTNAYGGTTTRNNFDGQTTHTNVYGGSTTHSWDGATAHTNMYGGTTAGVPGYGTVHTTAGGYSTYRPPAATVVAPVYAPYHPPVAVAAYTPGCINCASIVSGGAVVGVAAGTAVVRSAEIPRYPVGVNFARVPSGAVVVERGGVSYYQLGDTWFRPYAGANGVYYSVVVAP